MKNNKVSIDSMLETAEKTVSEAMDTIIKNAYDFLNANNKVDLNIGNKKFTLTIECEDVVDADRKGFDLKVNKKR